MSFQGYSFIGERCYIIVQRGKVMDKYPLIRKCLAVGIIFLFVGTGIIPSAAKSLPVIARPVPHPGNFFGLNSNIIISWDANDTEKPIIPRGEIRSVVLNIKFWVTWGLFGHLINDFLTGQPVITKVSIVDKPEWCTAIISQKTLTSTIPRNENTYYIEYTVLSLQVADDAPAFELFPVTIQATMEPLYGPFGLFTVMQGTTQVVNVTFTVGYRPLIMPQFPQGDIIKTPPLVQVEFPIGITNLGNDRTIVQNEVVDYPNGWTITLPAQLCLEVGEYWEMNLSIIAPSDFSGEKTITVSFTPHSADDPSLIGETTYESILTYYHP
jgi:hypothetical protein